MSDEVKRKKQLTSVLIILAGLFVAAILSLQYGRGEIDKAYFNFYMWLAGLSIAHGVIVNLVDYSFADKDNSLAKALFLYDHNSPLRPGSSFSLWVWFSAATILGLVLLFSTTLSSYSVYSVPSPYAFGVEPLAVQGHNFFTNIFFGAIVPGLFEEWVVFAGIQALQSFVLLGLTIPQLTRNIARSHAFYYLVMLVTTGAVAYFAVQFSTAHGRYGGNEPVFVYAFGFEFIVQLLNQMGGAFVSWIPHILHNSGVVSSQTMALLVGQEWAAPVLATVLVLVGMVSTYYIIKFRRGSRA